MNHNDPETYAIQSKLLEMFRFFHAFCESQRLVYVAQGGTMLGAVRHQGFIPWDDDIDVGMPRQDFEELCRLMGEPRQEEQYVLESVHTFDPDYWYPYAKLYDTTTTFKEKTRNNLKRGLFIDIFPLDGLGHTYEEARSNYREIYRLNKTLVLRRLKVGKGRAWYKNAVMKAVQALPFRSFDEKELCRRIDAVCRSRRLEDYEFGGNLLGNWGFKEVIPVSIIGKPTLYPFEDTFIYGVQDYDGYLTHLYGDWRKLPPKEKQVTHHHQELLDLDHGYRE